MRTFAGKTSFPSKSGKVCVILLQHLMQLNAEQQVSMTTIDDIKKLIAKDETRTLELKKTTGELYKGMETACAFLNSDGGWLKTFTPQVEDSYTPSHTPSDDDFTSSHNEIHNQLNIITPQDKVFEFCKSPKSIVEIAAMLGVNDRRWVRKKYIAPFIGTKLQMTIPDKPNSQNQKYVIIKE